MIHVKTFKNAAQDLKPELVNCIAQFKSNPAIGYLSLPKATTQWTESEKLGHEIQKNYDHLVLVGIGGSSMGPRCLAELADKKNISFLDNIDGVETEALLEKINSNTKIAWLFISKSGTTIEVLWTLDLILQKHNQSQKDFWSHTFFITETTKNTLHQLSLDHKRPCLEIPLNVGGRFSVLSPVGLVVAAFLGLNLKDLQAGTQAALNDHENVVKLSEQFLASMERNEFITLFWFYSSRMRWFGSWLQQLWAESLGKKHDRTGAPAYPFSTPMTAIGASDQHSILQQVIDGPKNKFVCIFRFKNIETSSDIIQAPAFTQTRNMAGLQFGSLIKAETLATQKALETQEISTSLITMDELNTKTLGYLFMLFQMIISTMAEYKNINAYDQPAVEHGKKLIKDYLKA
jgi:glucose-6-phosphate isomerase